MWFSNIGKIVYSKPVLIGSIITILCLNFVGEKTFNLPIGAKNQKLDSLYEDLRNAQNSIVAQQLESEIFLEQSTNKSERINILMQTAQAAFEQNDIENALLTIDQILRLDANFNEARNVKAAILFRLGDKTAALTNLERIVEIEPRNNIAWAAIGGIKFEMSDIDGARVAYEKALWLNPYNDAAKRGLFEIESKTNGIGM